MQTVMLLCSERWEQGTFSGQEPALGGSGAAARGCGLTGIASFLLPGISASPSRAGGEMLAALGPLFPIQMATGCNLGRAHAGMPSPPPPACGPNPNQAAGRDGGLPVAGTPLWARARASTRRSTRANSQRAATAPCGPGHGRTGNPSLGIWGAWKNRPEREGGAAAAASRARGSGDDIWKQGCSEAVILGVGIFGIKGCLEEGMFASGDISMPAGTAPAPARC